MPDIIIETYLAADGIYYPKRRKEGGRNTSSFRRRTSDEKSKDLVVAKPAVEATGPYEVSDKPLGQKIDIMV